MKHVRALTLARKGGVIASEKTLMVINYLHKASLNLYYEACNISDLYRVVFSTAGALVVITV